MVVVLMLVMVVAAMVVLVKTLTRLVIRLMEEEEFEHPTLTIVDEDEPHPVSSYIIIQMLQLFSLAFDYFGYFVVHLHWD